MFSATDHAKKHGLEDLIQATPSWFDHHYLFEILQRKTLEHRLNDSYSCLVGSLIYVFIIVIAVLTNHAPVFKKDMKVKLNSWKKQT